jgi:hypothetical protein
MQRIYVQYLWQVIENQHKDSIDIDFTAEDCLKNTICILRFADYPWMWYTKVQFTESKYFLPGMTSALQIALDIQQAENKIISRESGILGTGTG